MSNKYALIIGNNEYQDANLAKLTAPIEDVNDLVDILRNPDIGGFDEVIQIENEAAANAQRQIARFFAKRKREDLLLMYFSGHSVLNEQGHLYLAFKDTEHDLLSGTAIPTRFITQEMDLCRSQRQVLVLDCCHSGAYSKGAKSALGTRVGVASAFEGNGYGRVILTASDSTQYAWEGDQFFGEATNSLFTHFLIEGLQSGEADLDQDGWVSLDELYDYVYGRVVEETPRQTPGKWSYRRNGNILIAKNPNPKDNLATLPPGLEQAISNPLVSVREAIVKDLESLLHSTNKGVSIAALRALERLVEDDSRKISKMAKSALASFGNPNPKAVPISKPIEDPPPIEPPLPKEEGSLPCGRASTGGEGRNTKGIKGETEVQASAQADDHDRQTLSRGRLATQKRSQGGSSNHL